MQVRRIGFGLAQPCLDGLARWRRPRRGLAGKILLYERAELQRPVAGLRGGARHHRLAVRQKESRFWNSDLQILGFERVREIAYSPWAPGTIPRRFCRAVALVSDGRKHAVYYWIGEDTGFIGASWGVDGAWSGSTAIGPTIPRCKMARP